MWPSENWSAIPDPADILYPKNFGRLSQPRDMGPIALLDTSEGLTAYEWELEFLGDKFWLGRVGQDKQVLFEEQDSIAADLTFDTAANAFVAYEKSDGVYAYWYDPITQDYVNQLISTGATNPFCTLDLRDPAQVADSDILVFYERADAIYFQRSDDRYTVEYATPVTSLSGKKIRRCGLGINNRFVVAYS